MATGVDMVVSTLRMLNTRYDGSHNTTIQLVIEKHIAKSFLIRSSLSRRTARSMSLLLSEKGVLMPKNHLDNHKRTTIWQIDMDRAQQYLTELEKKGDDGERLVLRIDPPRDAPVPPSF
jgi:hypothetical protein